MGRKLNGPFKCDSLHKAFTVTKKSSKCIFIRTDQKKKNKLSVSIFFLLR